MIIGGLSLIEIWDRYRVTHHMANLGWVDFDFDSSTVCPILPGLVGIWQKLLSSWERW